MLFLGSTKRLSVLSAFCAPLGEPRLEGATLRGVGRTDAKLYGHVILQVLPRIDEGLGSLEQFRSDGRRPPLDERAEVRKSDARMKMSLPCLKPRNSPERIKRRNFDARIGALFTLSKWSASGPRC